MHMTRARSVFVLAALVAAAACSDSTGPLPPLDEAALVGDMNAAASATDAPAAASLAVLGDQMNFALGGGVAVVAAEAVPALLKDPLALVKDGALAKRLAPTAGGTTASVIPQAALGKTFVYSTDSGRYVLSARTGAPANGVRFVLYAVDPLFQEIVLPLTEVGYADLTRTVVNDNARARVEVWTTGGETKVLDYVAIVGGTLVAPAVTVEGFSRNGADSLAFRLVTRASLANESVSINWRAAVPSRDLVTVVEQVLTGGEVGSVAFDGKIASANGVVTMKGTLQQQSGGTITVKVNGETFARIVLATPSAEPEITGPTGEPLTEQQVVMLQQIFAWFQGAYALFFGLLAPVSGLLDLAF